MEFTTRNIKYLCNVILTSLHVTFYSSSIQTDAFLTHAHAAKFMGDTGKHGLLHINNSSQLAVSCDCKRLCKVREFLALDFDDVNDNENIVPFFITFIPP
jgi:hypothetical protein